MKLDLRQLRHVLALDRHRNFGRAAEAIGLTQPALSRSLQALEDEIGARLFDRDRSRVEPTAVGARLEAGMRGLARRRRWIWVPCLAAAAIIVWKGDRLWQRELTALSPVPIEARQLDAALRADLGAPDVRYVVAVPANDREAALRGAEASVARLAPLVEQGVLSHVDSPTRFLPSATTQRERQAALPPATELMSRLRLALHGLPLRPEKLQRFVEDVERARQHSDTVDVAEYHHVEGIGGDKRQVGQDECEVGLLDAEGG